MEPLYFGPGERLFGCYHAPATGSPRGNGVALVLVHPGGHEYLQFHRVLRQLAVMLAEAGFPVLRFDLRGCGDSLGDESDWSLGAWSEDIGTALDEARERAGVPRAGLIGLRLGATLSAATAAARDDVESLVLWDPVLSGTRHLEELDAGHASMLGYAHVLPRKDETRREVLGYALPAPLLSEVQAIDLLAESRRPAPRTLVVESNEAVAQEPLRARLEELDAKAELQSFSNPHLWVWTEDFAKVHVPHKILQAVTAWMSQGVPA